MTSDELAAIDIRGFARYQTGSREIRDLWSYVGTLAGTLGHIVGEGGCTPTYVPREYLGIGEPVRVREGGAFFPHHSTMSAFPQLSDDEVRTIVGHVLGWNHGL